jgi:hypothetical protein
MWNLPWQDDELQPIHFTKHRVYYKACRPAKSNTILVPATSLAITWRAEDISGSVEPIVPRISRPLTEFFSVLVDRSDPDHPIAISFRYENREHSVEPLREHGPAPAASALHAPLRYLQCLVDRGRTKEADALVESLSRGRLVYARIER